jgi:hypothetical protein
MPREYNRVTFSDAEAARLIGLSTETVAELSKLDLKPEGANGEWNALQVLAIGSKVHTLRAGATKTASDEAFWILSRMDFYRLRRDYRSFGRRYLRLIGERCEPQILNEAEAFDPVRMRHATDAGLSHVIFDIGHWIDRIEAERVAVAKAAYKRRAQEKQSA